MPEIMFIKSKIRDYKVFFVDDVITPLKRYTSLGAFYVIDSLIYELYRDEINNFITKDRIILLESNEQNKTIDSCKKIIEKLVSLNVRKNELLISIGGGVIQDITAFTASILYRGVDWIFFPTTLLSQADSCIGGKTSINIEDKKNLVGNFYPPAEIYIDTGFLKSLSDSDIFSGIGEMLHYYYYLGSPSFEKIILDREKLLKNRDLFVPYLKESLRIKKNVIEIDEFDRNERNKFNYGHTFGHALESYTDYTVNHGQAVTIGMDMANFLSMKLGIMSQETFDNAHKVLVKNFPEYNWNNFDIEKYIHFLSKDKKNLGENLTCIFAERPGSLFKMDIQMDESFKQILISYFNDFIL